MNSSQSMLLATAVLASPGNCIQMQILKILQANKRTHQENTYNIGVASR